MVQPTYLKRYTLRIAIIGGGIAGLSTAISLTQIGLNVEVFERRTAADNLGSTIGAGIVLWPNACFVLSELGLLDEVNRVAGDTTAMDRRTCRGEWLGRIDFKQINDAIGFPSLSVFRSDLMDILYRRACDLQVPIHFGTRVSGIETTGTSKTRMRFTDNSSHTPDLVLGADGRMKSATRLFVHGNNAPVYQGFVNWVGTYRSDEPIFEGHAVEDFWGVGLRFGIVPVSGHAAYWAGGAKVGSVPAETTTSHTGDLHALFDDWPAPIPSIIAQASDSTVNKIFVHDLDPISTWHKANVLLIGDAAHAALPTSGQGACQALEDAWWLARQIDQSSNDVDQTLRAFTRSRFEKTTSITMGGRRLAEQLFCDDPMECERRDLVARQTDYSELALGMARGWSAGLSVGDQ